MIEYLYQALTSPFGIKLATSNIAHTRAKCYKARAEAQDPDLARLQFRPHPLGAPELWIIKGEPPKLKVEDLDGSEAG